MSIDRQKFVSRPGTAAMAAWRSGGKGLSLAGAFGRGTGIRFTHLGVRLGAPFFQKAYEALTPVPLQGGLIVRGEIGGVNFGAHESYGHLTESE